MAIVRLRHSVRAGVAPVAVACAGLHVIRYGLVLILLWIGGMKFTAYESEAIRPMVANSPLMG